MDNNIGFNRVSRVFFALCKSVDTPVALGCWLRFKYGEYQQLTEISVDPKDYCTAYSFHLDYVVTEYLSKYKGFPAFTSLKEVAISNFKKFEETCRQTNIRIQHGMHRGFSPRVEAVLFTARRKIAAALGDLDAVDLSRSMWGPGVTTSIRGRRVAMTDKIGEFPIRVSRSALPYVRNELSKDIHWARALGIPADGLFSPLPQCFTIEECSRVTTVPKNAKTDRTIAIEPTGNIFLQKAIGEHMKDRLRRVGVDLRRQSVNQKLSQLGSSKGFLATVDMKAASDTISYRLVEALLPEPWFNLLNALRTKSYKLDGVESRFYKFSTMGNGFTFELESLLFWAIAQSCIELSGSSWKRASVYGDDVIIPVECIEYFKECCDAFGFTVNSEKTHYNSAFRESCGEHYFLGVNVTPIYQKEVPDVLEEVYRLANRIRRLAYRMGSDRYCDSTLRSSWLAAIDGIVVRHFVPLNDDSDDGLACSFNEYANHIRPVGHGAYKLRVLRQVPLEKRSDNRTILTDVAYRMRADRSETLRGVHFESDRDGLKLVLSEPIAVRTTTVRRATRRKNGWRTFTGTLHANWI